MDRLTHDGSTARPARQRAGFSLLEVVIALGILAFGLLGVAAMELHAMRAGHSSRHTSQAAEIARSQLETLRNVPFADPQMAQTAGWTAPQLVQAQVQSSGGTVVEQDYDVQWRITDLNPPQTLRSIDVRVTWNEPKRPNRSVTLSTIRVEE